MTAAVIVLCIAVLIVLLLVVPLRVELRGSVHNRLDLKLKFKYLFGLICWQTGDSQRTASVPAVEDDFSWLPRAYNASQTDGLWERVGKLVKRLWGRVKIENVDIELSVSLGDDYYTGTIAGYLIPVCLFINSRFDTDIRLQPAFEEDLFIEGHVNADWQAPPLRIIWPCLAFVLSLPFRQARRRYYA